MDREEFLKILGELPVDICDSCYWIGNKKCPRGKDWRDSDERKNQSRMLHAEECDEYIYWRTRYEELGNNALRIRVELGMETGEEK